MTMNDLIEERERLLKQRMDILQAALKPVQESDCSATLDFAVLAT